MTLQSRRPYGCCWSEPTTRLSPSATAPGVSISSRTALSICCFSTFHARHGRVRDDAAGPAAASVGPDRRDIRPFYTFGPEPLAGLPDHGHQARRGEEPAETFQAGRPHANGCRLS